MFEFKPEKLNVSYRDKIEIKDFVLPRKYTLTHSDESGELFLSIGKKYDLDQINYNLRDEVIGSWEKDEEEYLLITLEMDRGDEINNTIRRDKLFREELELAIRAIIFGDNLFFENNKSLYEAPIRVKFNSRFSEYDSLEEIGKIKDYKYDLNRLNNELFNYKFNPFPILLPAQPKNYIKAVNDKKKKNDIIEKALLAVLDSYISKEIYTMFGKDTPYCLKKAEIIDGKVVHTYGPCSEEYEVVIGLKVGKKQTFYNNFIITFLISDNVVKVKKVKNVKK